MNVSISRYWHCWLRKSCVCGALAILLCIGCGTTTQRVGTEQLLMSDAVDLAVSQIDFAPLSGEKIFLDSSFLQSVKGFGFVNAPYIISSLRQQLTASGCLLQDKREEADVIVEARVGALGTDGHEVIYGVPKNNLLSSASSVISNVPNIPTIPELSAARTDAQCGIAKMMVFAYDRESRQPVWQSGVARAESTSRNSWVLGAGPFQRGTVHEGTRFAGEKITPPLDGLTRQIKKDKKKDEDEEVVEKEEPEQDLIAYFESHEFVKAQPEAKPEENDEEVDSNDEKDEEKKQKEEQVATKPKEGSAETNGAGL